MRKLVECVPNFSEGRDRAVIDAIADAIRATAGCTLLDVDPGHGPDPLALRCLEEPDEAVEIIYIRYRNELKASFFGETANFLG